MRHVYLPHDFAGVVKLADTQDLGSCAVRCAGSNPVTRTKLKNRKTCVISEKCRIYTGFSIE